MKRGRSAEISARVRAIRTKKIDLTNIVAHPFTEGLNAYQVLSKSYEVNFKALFVQASESEV